MAEEQKEEKIQEKGEAKGEPKEEKKEELEEKKKKEPIKVPEKFKKLIGEIEKMSVLDLAELVKVLEKKFEVSSSAPAVVAMPAVPASAEATSGKEEEKTVFNVVLSAVGEKKIEVIKAVRDITQKGLKEAKDLVDAAATGPQVVKENVKKEEAEEIKKKFEEGGAKIELK